MKPKVLIVDDRPENLVALERLLIGVGADFIRAESGNEALAKTLEYDFALALIDVQMPEMDGFETVELMRQQERTRYLPTIFISAIYREESHLIKGMESGAVDFIVKPIVPEILIGKVKIFLELYNQKRELELLANEREAQQQVFKQLARGLISGVDDQEIFDNIVTTCAAIFHTEHAMVGRLRDDGQVETLAYWRNGQLGASLIYPLAGTPSEKVIEQGTCLYPEGVQQLFPADTEFRELGIEGYAGVSFPDRQGRPLGLLTCFSCNVLQVPDYIGELMDIIATRAAAVIERQLADKSRLELQERLQQAQKMEAIGTLAGGIAHDFNNILAAILGYTSLAINKVPAQDPLRHKLDQIMHAGNRAAELTKQILAFSRHSNQGKQPVQFNLAVKEALKLLRATIPTTIEICQEHIDSNCGMVNADPTEIHQVVMNLCTNAYHSMRESGGVLTVSLLTEQLAEGEEAQRLELEPGEYIKLVISDTGTGMDKATRDKIFEPYFTTKSLDDGTGLGLAVVHGVVKGSQGAISVTSEPGKGTTFQVYFPKISNQAEAVLPERPSVIPGGDEHILVLDDEEPIRMVVSRQLEALGYRTTVSGNPLEALRQFKEQPDRFNLIVTDMTMPNMNGAQFAQEVLAIKPEALIILCTGFSELTNQEQASALGIKGYLMKPTSQSALGLAVRSVLDGS